MSNAIVLSGIGAGLIALNYREEIKNGVITPVISQWNLLSLLKIPRGLCFAVQVSHMAAFMGRSICHLRRQIDHPILSLGGVVVNEVLGKKGVVHMTARVVTIARIVLETVTITSELGADASRVKYASFFIAASTSAYLSCVEREKEITTPWIIQRLSQFSDRLGTVAKKVMRLNLLFFELYDTINPGPHTETALVENLFIEMRQISLLVANKDQKVTDFVTQNRALIDTVFSAIHLPWRAEGVVSLLERVEQKMGPLKKVAESIQDGVKGVLRDLSAQFVYDEIGEDNRYEIDLGAPRSADSG